MKTHDEMIEEAAGRIEDDINMIIDGEVPTEYLESVSRGIAKAALQPVLDEMDMLREELKVRDHALLWITDDQNCHPYGTANHLDYVRIQLGLPPKGSLVKSLHDVAKEFAQRIPALCLEPESKG